ncbi:MAG TPA: hypothetical protein VFU28_24530 [Vicinamibacterales bacterium]|nr:hypothetical protein [Vicinamibacterales bacterium]
MKRGIDDVRNGAVVLGAQGVPLKHISTVVLRFPDDRRAERPLQNVVDCRVKRFNLMSLPRSGASLTASEVGNIARSLEKPESSIFGLRTALG